MFDHHLSLFPEVASIEEARESPPEPRGQALILIFGVILPALTILLEGLCHPLANAYANPLATPLHWLACVSVPACILWGWRHPQAESTPFTAAFACAIALFYCVTLGPVLFFGFFMLLAFLVGVLPLCPLLAALAAGLQLAQCRSFASWRTLQGAGCAALLLFCAEAPAGLSRRMIRTGEVTALARAMPGIITHVDDLCRGAGPKVGLTPLEGWMVERPEPTEACRVAYRISGQLPAIDLPMWDRSLGGIATGTVRPDIKVAASHLQGKPQTGVPVMQFFWDLEFQNRGGRTSEEARFRVALPAQGVINGATLWVDGEPREAAFAGTRQVREAYRKVAVVQRRDPLLVTWAGQNEVFVQCFPIPAHGNMRIRLSIAAPVSGPGQFSLPSITEDNFGVKLEPTVDVERPGGVPRIAAAQDPLDAHSSIEARLVEGQAPKDLFVVIDGSIWMESHRVEIEKALQDWRRKQPVRVWLAGDQARELPAQEPLQFAGGTDNVPALRSALTAATPDTWVVWIHGRQPYTLSSAVEIEALAKRPGRFLGYRVEPGVNEVWDTLARGSQAELRTGKIGGVLDAQVWRFERSSQPAAQQAPALGALWAATQPPEVARRQRVVTKEVGAVVLENTAQYTANGLQDPEGVETPEPATWLLMASALGTIAGWQYQKKGRARRLVLDSPKVPEVS